MEKALTAVWQAYTLISFFVWADRLSCQSSCPTAEMYLGKQDKSVGSQLVGMLVPQFGMRAHKMGGFVFFLHRNLALWSFN